MKKLIEIQKQDYLVVCDNKNCDYKVENPTKDPRHNINGFLNVPCPKCGENLLTEEDLNTYKNFLKSVDFLNKWFGWIAIFIPKKYEKKATAHAHRGLNIEVEK